MYEPAARAVSSTLKRSRAMLGDMPGAVLSELPSGRAGTIATLKHMKDYVHASLRNPAQVIRETANNVFRDYGIPPRKWNAQLGALQRFVHQNIRYVRDPVGLELVQAPEVTLQKGYGDCDDQSTLLASLLMATGHPARFAALGFKGGPFSHVLVEAKSGKLWIPLETIIEKPFGWFPPGVTSKYSLNL